MQAIWARLCLSSSHNAWSCNDADILRDLSTGQHLDIWRGSPSSSSLPERAPASPRKALVTIPYWLDGAQQGERIACCVVALHPETILKGRWHTLARARFPRTPHVLAHRRRESRERERERERERDSATTTEKRRCRIDFSWLPRGWSLGCRYAGNPPPLRLEPKGTTHEVREAHEDRRLAGRGI